MYDELVAEFKVAEDDGDEEKTRGFNVSCNPELWSQILELRRLHTVLGYKSDNTSLLENMVHIATKVLSGMASAEEASQE